MRNTEDIVAAGLALGCMLQLVGCVWAWGPAGLFFGLAYACFIILFSHWLARILAAVERRSDY